MLRLILLKNRKLLKLIKPTIFSLGCALICVFGAMIISGDGTIKVDVSRFPVWVGYVFLYSGFVALCMFVIDWGYSSYRNFRKVTRKNIGELPSRFKLRFTNRSSDKALLDKIRECEKQ